MGQKLSIIFTLSLNFLRDKNSKKEEGLKGLVNIWDSLSLCLSCYTYVIKCPMLIAFPWSQKGEISQHFLSPILFYVVILDLLSFLKFNLEVCE